MKVKTVADLVVDTLGRVGVERIYGLPGDSLNGLTNVLRTSVGLEWMHVRHEETAAFAAAAEAHMTSRLAVCAGSCGPGNTHLMNSLFDANRSRVPVLAIRHADPERRDRHQLLVLPLGRARGQVFQLAAQRHQRLVGRTPAPYVTRRLRRRSWPRDREAVQNGRLRQKQAFAAACT